MAPVLDAIIEAKRSTAKMMPPGEKGNG